MTSRHRSFGQFAATIRGVRLALLPVLLAGASLGSGCSYVGTWAKQSYYSFQLRHAPRRQIAKHMLAENTFFVFGKVQRGQFDASTPLVVLAIANAPIRDEIVDVSHSVRGDSYYALNLPAGEYRIVAAADLNCDGLCTERETIAERMVNLIAAAPDRIVGDCDLDGSNQMAVPCPVFSLAVQPAPRLTPSVFYPRGSIRQLDDPIFSPEMGTLGLYEPAAFMETAPMLFYALEEDLGYKVPVIFVHGIGGSAREFSDIVARLDRSRYRPWFFHYPSGGDLRQLSGMFYELFLSGNTIPKPDVPVVIVAHSMGGVVVREALNRCRGTGREAVVGKVITIASPLGGHPAAARAKYAPVIPPAWRDLDPASAFVQELHRNPIPQGTAYTLVYAYGDPRLWKHGEKTDGTVPLASQLNRASADESSDQYGFDCSHTGVLHDPGAIRQIAAEIAEIKSNFPDDHLRAFDRGGYNFPLPENVFTPLDRYFVRHLGHYLDAMVAGEIAPIHPTQQQFIEEARGHQTPQTPAAKAWLKLDQWFPQRLQPATARAPALEQPTLARLQWR